MIDYRSDEAGTNMAMRLWRIAGKVRELAEQMERDAGRYVREKRAEEIREAGPDVAVEEPQPAEAVDSSQMIPAEQVERADRGGE